MSYEIAIVGATGLVGNELIQLIEKSNISIKKILFFASEKSLNKKLPFRNKKISVDIFSEKKIENVDFIFFATSSKISREIIPKIKRENLYCIDLSSHFRLDKNALLIIPEINGALLTKKSNLVASPNCTTTIMLMPIFNLHKAYKIKRIHASTYQAASGGGKNLIEKLLTETKHTLKTSKKSSYGMNLFLHDSPLNKDRYSEEEVKMIKETHKILNNEKILINAICVRVPVIRAHSIALNIEFEDNFELDDVYSIIKSTKGVKILENYEKNLFATPNDAESKNEVFVSRIRKDISKPKALDMWIVSDQLLKGASLNAFQIFEKFTTLLAAK